MLCTSIAVALSRTTMSEKDDGIDEAVSKSRTRFGSWKIEIGTKHGRHNGYIRVRFGGNHDV